MKDLTSTQFRSGQVESIEDKRILTNIYPVKIDFEEFQVYQIKYEDGLLEKLREKHNATHSFFRFEEHIYASNNTDREVDLGGEFITVSIIHDWKIAGSLIRHIFFRTFKNRFPQMTPAHFYPFRITSTKSTDDILYKHLPEQYQNRIGYKKQFEVQLRRLEFGGRPGFGFVISMDRKWIFSIDCLEIAMEGYPLIGKEVVHSEGIPGLKGVLAPSESLIGTIESIDGDRAVVGTNEGNMVVPLKELFLRRTKATISDYLTFVLGQGIADKILGIVESAKPIINDARKIQSEIQKLASILAVDKDSGLPVGYQNNDGFFFEISKYGHLPHSRFNLELGPTFIFDHAAVKKEKWNPDRGLTNYGPYDAATFTPKTPKMLAIFHKDARGRFTEFLAALINGLPKSRFFKKGFKSKYHFHDFEIHDQEIASYDYDSYYGVISELDYKPDIVIIEIPPGFRKLSTEDNPYYRLKSCLLSMDIPVQFITTPNAKYFNENILNAIALQMYAKIGGVPWVLPSKQSIDHELVIGIGHSIIRRNAYKGNDQDRVVGITTFFSRDGQYLLGGKAKDVGYEHYFEALLNSLRSAFEELQKTQAWNEGDTVRLIFHIFKPIKDVEFGVVSELVREYSKYNIQFAFVTIGKWHPFRLFNPRERGNTKGNKTIGAYLPTRGTNLKLDKSSCLIQMLGVRELKTDKHRGSNPLLIRVRGPQGEETFQDIEQLLFTDLHYIVQQIYDFTYLSWRTFLPTELPATMLYSNLIAGLLGKLRKVEGWKPESINMSLKYKKWFL